MTDFRKVGGSFSQSRRFIFPKSVAHLLNVGGSFSQKSVAHFPKIGDVFSQKRWLIFPKSVAHFPKIGGGFPQSRWQNRGRIDSKSVTYFLKVGDRFPRSRRLVSPKSVAHFPKVGDRFPQSRWNIFIKSVAHFPTTEPIMLFQTPGIVLSPKLSVICQPIAAKFFSESATFQNQLKVATKVVLLLGGNISCMFSRKAGVWIYHVPVPRSLTKGFLLALYLFHVGIVHRQFLLENGLGA